MKHISLSRYVAFASLMIFLLADQANAYIDPATGSMAMQVILGSLAAGYLFMRERVNAVFYSLKKLFSGKKD